MIEPSDVVEIRLSVAQLEVIIGCAVEKAIDNRLGSIESDEHRRHHEWMERMLNWGDKLGQDIFGTIIRSLIYGLIALIVIGFGVWARGKGMP